MKNSRPNILIIQADQLAAKYLGAYGFPIASTPHIDSLAKGQLHDWDYKPNDELEQHCLRADKVYSKWAYQDIVDYRFPEE
jgi:hypothetical protein